MNQKIDITKYVLVEEGLPIDDRSTHRLLPKWWHNPRKKDTGGLRLTQEGFDKLSNHIKAHRLEIEHPAFYTNQLIIWLDKFIDCPWYLTKNELYVFNEKVAVQMALFSGNIARYSAAKAKKPLPAS